MCDCIGAHFCGAVPEKKRIRLATIDKETLRAQGEWDDDFICHLVDDEYDEDGWPEEAEEDAAKVLATDKQKNVEQKEKQQNGKKKKKKKQEHPSEEGAPEPDDEENKEAAEAKAKDAEEDSAKAAKAEADAKAEQEAWQRWYAEW